MTRDTPFYYVWPATEPLVQNFEWKVDETPVSNLALMLCTCIGYVTFILGLKWFRTKNKMAPVNLGYLPAIHNLILCLWSLAMFLGTIHAMLLDSEINKYDTGMGKYTWLLCFPSTVKPVGYLWFWSYVYYLSKYYELLDTVILVLKNKPLSFLHVYHHATIVFLCWLWLTNTQSLQIIAITINTGIHVMMYFYYFMHSIGMPPPWKMFVTNSQIIQFMIGTFVSFPLIYFHFTRPTGCAGFESFCFNLFFNSSLLYLFVDFHIRNYGKAAKAAKDFRPRVNGVFGFVSFFLTILSPFTLRYSQSLSSFLSLLLIFPYLTSSVFLFPPRSLPLTSSSPTSSSPHVLVSPRSHLPSFSSPLVRFSPRSLVPSLSSPLVLFSPRFIFPPRSLTHRSLNLFSFPLFSSPLFSSSLFYSSLFPFRLLFPLSSSPLFSSPFFSSPFSSPSPLPPSSLPPPSLPPSSLPPSLTLYSLPPPFSFLLFFPPSSLPPLLFPPFSIPHLLLSFVSPKPFPSCSHLSLSLSHFTYLLALALQRAFVQARIEGLGKPREEALGDFVDACMAARAQSLGFKDLQLKLLLAEAALPTPFSMMGAAGAGEEGEGGGAGGELGGIAGERLGEREREGKEEEGEQGAESGKAGAGGAEEGGKGGEGEEERVEGDLDSDDERKSNALKALRGPFLAEVGGVTTKGIGPWGMEAWRHGIWRHGDVRMGMRHVCAGMAPLLCSPDHVKSYAFFPIPPPSASFPSNCTQFIVGSLILSHSLTPVCNPFHPHGPQEEVRVRTLWVRLVYTTLNMVDNIRSGEGYEGVVSADGSQPPDPTDGFVQQMVKAAFDQGRDYNFVLREQESQATPVPPSVATLQQIQLLILLALSKGMAATS
ncbi:unnamed protein product [Closterium sp. Yama58-4]|nr:unnamed protein product [Closterium sp. Yama58-4]